MDLISIILLASVLAGILISAFAAILYFYLKSHAVPIYNNSIEHSAYTFKEFWKTIKAEFLKQNIKVDSIKQTKITSFNDIKQMINEKNGMANESYSNDIQTNLTTEHGKAVFLKFKSIFTENQYLQPPTIRTNVTDNDISIEIDAATAPTPYAPKNI